MNRFALPLVARGIGASAVLLAPITYQKLFEDEVFGLYETVSRQPSCVYDNTGTTHFEFSDELYGSIVQRRLYQDSRRSGIT